MAYNGWTNYQTFRIAVEIDSNEIWQRTWNGRAAELYQENNYDLIETRYILAQELKDFFYEESPFTYQFEKLSDVYKEILYAAIEDVNWLELAESLIND